MAGVLALRSLNRPRTLPVAGYSGVNFDRDGDGNITQLKIDPGNPLGEVYGNPATADSNLTSLDRAIDATLDPQLIGQAAQDLGVRHMQKQEALAAMASNGPNGAAEYRAYKLYEHSKCVKMAELVYGNTYQYALQCGYSPEDARKLAKPAGEGVYRKMKEAFNYLFSLKGKIEPHY